MTLNECYILLGVDEHSTMADIKSAYRTKVLEHHPDRNNAKNHELYLKIQMAFKQLVAFRKTISNKDFYDVTLVYKQRRFYEFEYKSKVKKLIERDKKRNMNREHSRVNMFWEMVVYFFIVIILLYVLYKIKN